MNKTADYNYEHVKETIVYFFKKNIVEDERFKNYAYANICEILYDIIDINKFPDIIKYRKLYEARQKKIHESVRATILNFEQLDILKDMIILKGISLEDLIYNGQMRFYTDLDIAVKYCDGNRILKILKNNGFAYKKNKTLFYNKENLVRIFGRRYLKWTHHIELYKNNITLEVHFNINFNNKTNANINKLFANSINLNNYKIYNVIDNIIYLSTHMITHLKYFNKLNEDNYIRLQSFAEMCLLVTKYNGTIDWDLIILTSIKNKQIDYLLVFLYLFSYIFHDEKMANIYKKFSKFLHTKTIAFLNKPIKNMFLG